MKYLKLVNVPWKYFQDKKYGKHVRGGPIRWIAMGFNAQVIQKLLVQFEDGDDHYDYIPIADEDKVKDILPLIETDMQETKELLGDLANIQHEIVADDRENWVAQKEQLQQQLQEKAAEKVAARRLAEEQAYERMKAEQGGS